MNQAESHSDGGNSSHQLNNESVAIFLIVKMTFCMRY